MSMEYIRKHYNVPAKRGGVVRYRSKVGRITSARGAYLQVLFPEMKLSLRLHPKSIEFLPF